MQFLRTLFWVVLAVFLAIIARNNWSDVTINLWGSAAGRHQASAAGLVAALLGFLPTFLWLRAAVAAGAAAGRHQSARTAAGDSPAAVRLPMESWHDQPPLRCARHARPRRRAPLPRRSPACRRAEARPRILRANGPAGVREIAGDPACPSSSTSSCTTSRTPSARRWRRCAARAGGADRPRRGRRGDAEGRQGRRAARSKVVAVTVLTSLDQTTSAAGVSAKPRRAGRAAWPPSTRSPGCDGIVCSGEEVAAAARWPEGYLRGSRPPPGGQRRGDQKRVVTPRRRLRAAPPCWSSAARSPPPPTRPRRPAPSRLPSRRRPR
jgi:hypothetical protein